MPLKRFLKSPAFFLILLIAFHGVCNFAWLSLNKRPFVDDEAFHLISAFKYHQALAVGGPDLFMRLRSVDAFYPPLVPFVAAVAGFICGISSRALIMTNLFFFGGTLVCVYLIGRRLKNSATGLLAAFLLSMYPMFFHLSRMFMLETGFCFFVALGILLLLNRHVFLDVRRSILFGVVFGLGMLTKQYTIVYLLPLSLWALFRSMHQSGHGGRGKLVLCFILSLVCALFVSSFWYLPVVHRMYPNLVRAACDHTLVPYRIPVFSLRSFLFYLGMLMNAQVLFVFFMLFIGCLFSLRTRNMRGAGFLFVWICVPYFVFSLYPNKFWYYTLGYLPAIALLCANVICRLNMISRWRITAFIVLFGLTQFFVVSFLDPWPKHRNDRVVWNFRGFEVRVVPFQLREPLAGVTYYPQQGNWKIDEIVNRIIREAGGRLAVIVVDGQEGNELARDSQIIRDHYSSVNYDALSYSFLRRGMPYKLILARYLKHEEPSGLKVRFIVTPRFEPDLRPFGLNLADYSLCAQYDMPDTSSVYLYKLRE